MTVEESLPYREARGSPTVMDAKAFSFVQGWNLSWRAVAYEEIYSLLGTAEVLGDRVMHHFETGHISGAL